MNFRNQKAVWRFVFSYQSDSWNAFFSYRKEEISFIPYLQATIMNFILFIFIISIVNSSRRGKSFKGKDTGSKLFSDGQNSYYTKLKAFSPYFQNDNPTTVKLREKFQANQAKKGSKWLTKISVFFPFSTRSEFNAVKWVKHKEKDFSQFFKIFNTTTTMNFLLVITLIAIFITMVLSSKRGRILKGRDTGEKLLSDANKNYYAKSKLFAPYFENNHSIKEKLRAKYEFNQAKKGSN